MTSEFNRRATDVGWRKYVTIELTVSMLVAMFVAGGVWVSLNSDIVHAHKKIDIHAVEMGSLTQSVILLQLDMGVVARDASYNKETSEEIKSDLKEQRKDIKDILKILRGIR